MTLMQKFLGASAALALTAGAASADPAILFDLGGKFDKSFNESAYNGAERWAAETGGSYAEVEIQSDAQREQAIRRFAESGANPIVMAGFSWGTPLAEVAADYPDTKFTIIDMVVDAPNVRSVVFNEHEGSYLVGVLAGMTTETNTVSFVGGMDIPLIRKFACGYAQGVKAANADATVVSNMTGTTPAAWNDPVKGSELTLAQISQGSDVVFAAAGGTGVGVLQTAADEGIFSIGVDANQNHLHPGSVLTSMLKRVDSAVYDAMSDGPDMETGFNVMSVANHGVGFAMDANNESIVSFEALSAAYAAAAQIEAGELVVHDYTSDETCPALDF
ncbi:BMP family ABC transporter substrate-binding protein [Loktanella sp. S4079]|uniref:BMP family ABC transporter substrate-binding protein n=1 Tax=Loktanella sp. S4079 TaxID=579483 RepID=UPI0005FA32B4|nr:BMP family ABC transporter substrate-binding protein [Loktanella sp. S4079]KJZ20819.1 membrane protein [Loktanella sp. S4079]